MGLMQVRRIAGSALVLAMLVAAGTAQAIPTYTTPCSTCHPADTRVGLAVRLLAIGSADATYSVEVSTTPGPAGWAVFGPGGKVTFGLRPTGQFTVPVGASYTVFGVAHETNHSAATVLSPVAPSILPISRPHLSPARPAHGKVFSVSGKLGRPHPVAASVTMLVQKRLKGVYRQYSRRAGTIQALSSTYSGRLSLRTSGHYRMRVLHEDMFDLPSSSRDPRAARPVGR